MSNVNARSAEKSKFIKNQSIGWNQFFDYRCFDTIFINISFFRNRFQSINVNFEIQKNVHLQFFFLYKPVFLYYSVLPPVKIPKTEHPENRKIHFFSSSLFISGYCSSCIEELKHISNLIEKFLCLQIINDVK